MVVKIGTYSESLIYLTTSRITSLHFKVIHLFVYLAYVIKVIRYYYLCSKSYHIPIGISPEAVFKLLEFVINKKSLQIHRLYGSYNNLKWELLANTVHKLL